MTDSFTTFLMVLRKIIKLKTAYKDHLIFIALSGLGDACYGFSVLGELKRKKNKKLLFLAGQYTYSLADCYDFIDEAVLLTPQEEIARIPELLADTDIEVFIAPME